MFVHVPGDAGSAYGVDSLAGYGLISTGLQAILETMVNGVCAVTNGKAQMV